MHVWKIAVTILATAGGLGAASQNASTAGAPQPATAAATQAPRTMVFRFENAAVEDILREVSAKLDIVIEKQGTIPGRVSIIVPEAVDADQAVSLLNSVLLSVRYSTIEIRRQGEGRRVLRVVTLEQAKKESPVIDE